jgi:hypothetical protein
MDSRRISKHFYDPRREGEAISLSFATLSFLVTTPECWVPALGDKTHGFPYLSGSGRLVLKDAIMMGAALVTMADSARLNLQRSSRSLKRGSPAGDMRPMVAQNKR